MGAEINRFQSQKVDFRNRLNDAVRPVWTNQISPESDILGRQLLAIPLF